MVTGFCNETQASDSVVCMWQRRKGSGFWCWRVIGQQRFIITCCKTLWVFLKEDVGREMIEHLNLWV
jgi:hypothetical protein